VLTLTNQAKERKVKILIADDDEMILHVLERIIEHQLPGVKVFARQVHCANDAVESISDLQPDIVLLDHSYDSSSTNGIDVIRNIKKKGLAKKIKKIISITSDETVVDEYRQLGIERINKVDFNTIVEKIKNFINDCIELIS